MDDGSVDGDVSSLLYDLDTVRRVGPTIGLVLNDAKCEIITNDDNVVNVIRAAMPNIRHISSRCSVPFEKLFQYTEVVIHAAMCSLLQERRFIRVLRRHSRHS